MLRIGDMVLQTVRSPDNGWGMHFLKDVMQIQDKEGIKIRVWLTGWNHASASVVYTRGTNSSGTLRLQNVNFGLHPLYLVRKIQTWVRRALKTRRQKRRLAFAMGMHARLGCQSVVMGLHADTLRLIL
jgi:hypothetical protein